MKDSSYDREDYKDDAIEKSLDWIRDHYKDLLEFTDNENEKLDWLKLKISQMYHEYDTSNDFTDACYNVIKRRIDEALDKPLDQITPLLMENVDTGPRRVTKRLYYSKAGKGK